MLPAQLSVWTRCVAMEMDSVIRQNKQKQTLFSLLYGSLKRCAVAGILKLA